MIIKLFTIILFFTIYIQAMDLDPKALQEIVDKNPQAIKEKVLLAKYYMKQGNDLKAMRLVSNVLKQNKNNIYAKDLKKSLILKKENKKLLKMLHFKFPISSRNAELYLTAQYAKNNYKAYIKAYQAFMDEQVLLRDIYHTNAAYIYLWDGKYVLSKEALGHVKQKNNLEKTKIEADICYYTRKYACAITLFEKLYSLNKDLESGIKLVYSYYYMGELDNAKRIYTELFEREPENKALKKVSKQFTKLDKKREILAREKYEKLRDIASLRDYCNILYSSDKKRKTLNLLKAHNTKYATNASYLLEATYLSWTDHFKDAMKILKPLIAKHNLDALLLSGKIASWEGNFVQAKKYLNIAIESGKDKKFIYESKKALAFVYKWEKENEKAKKLFLELLKEDKNDNEVVEAIMELNGDYKSLIKIYKNKASGAGNAKRLSELYFHNGEQDNAIEALKSYLKNKPHDLEATKSLALMLIDKKEFYSGFGNLEYYAAQKNDQNSSMLLAQQYYWRGFSKEALDVLDTLLSKYPKNKEAQELRAKILKVSPRFTTSNSGATVNDYFQSVGLKQLEIADALYFNGHHRASLMYYENYLSEEPDNHNVRLRYAFALENAGLYAKAEGEFALMLWNNDTDEINYHYGYNLMMNHKLDKAEKVFRKLKQNILKTIDPKLNTFVQNWKKAWESKEFSKYAKFYNENIRDDEIWALSKQQHFNDVTFISVGLYDIVSKKTKTQNKYIVKFYEEVATNKGTKKGNSVLEIVCSANQVECQIDQESFTEGDYKKFVSLEPILNQRLKDIKIFRKNPTALKRIIRKKKRTLSNYVKFKDIVLPNLKKNFKSEAEVLSGVNATVHSIESYVSHPTIGAYPKHVPREILQKGYYFEDSDDVIFASYDILGRRVSLSKKLSLGVDIGKFYIKEKDRERMNGYRYGLSLYYKRYTLRLGQNKYNGFSEFVPTLQYNNSYKRHGYQFEYTHQNALFYLHRARTLDERIVAHHFAFTDYASWRDKTSLWSSLAVNAYSNNDTEMVAQFDWRFFYDKLQKSELIYDLALEGWYDTHSKETDSFYSPKFADTTLLRIDTEYRFSKYLGLKAIAGAGYSFYDKYVPYKYGMNIFGEVKDGFLYDAGCLVSNSFKKSNNNNYRYLECNFSLGYTW